MEEIKKCIICENQSFTVFLNCKDHFLTEESFSVLECGKCGFRITSPRPLEKNLGEYYKSEEYISHSNTNKGLFNSMYQFIRKLTLNRKYKLISNYCNKGKILDIGCATGEFLNVFKKNNWSVFGIEPNEEARNYALNNYNISVGKEEDLNNLSPKSFDVITMWHVLEHVAHLNKRITELKEILKKDGVLIVAVPNSNSLDAKIYKEYWAAYDVPRHLYHFTQKSISELFNKHDFELLAIKPMKFDSYYVCMLSEKYRSGSKKYLKAAWNGFRSNFYAGMNNNEYSSLIYIFKNADI
ncbi:MAG: class I SAM-dependent methyltransferase [Bacteroidales bacterium]|nr:class I SAM-dependent methyltransferase [Bacteroidales bacterium]